MKILILSKARSETITTHKLFKNAILVIPETEKDKYKKIEIEKIYTPEIKGLSKLRNWCIEKFDEIIVMMDDDITSMVNLLGEKSMKIEEEKKREQLIKNLAVCAEDSGCAFFGFNPSEDIRQFKNHKPFSFNCQIEGVVGIIKKNLGGLRFDENNILKVDYDFLLQNLLFNRYVFADRRFSFVHNRNKNRGGNSKYRTAELIKKEEKYLKKKWGDMIRFSDSKKTRLTKIYVIRK